MNYMLLLKNILHHNTHIFQQPSMEREAFCIQMVLVTASTSRVWLRGAFLYYKVIRLAIVTRRWMKHAENPIDLH